MHVHMDIIQIVELYADISVLNGCFYIEMFTINKGMFIKTLQKGLDE